MTTIIGVQYEDHCLFMADNQVTLDGGRRYKHPDMKKISKVGDYLVAGSGEVAPCDIAQHLWTPPAMTTKDRKDTNRKYPLDGEKIYIYIFTFSHYSSMLTHILITYYSKFSLH